MQRADVVTGVVVYVLPLAVVSVLLASVGLGVLALALLAIEGTVVGLTVLARRRPVRPAGRAPRPWLVPLVMVAVVGAIALTAVLAAQVGRH